MYAAEYRLLKVHQKLDDALEGKVQIDIVKPMAHCCCSVAQTDSVSMFRPKTAHAQSQASPKISQAQCQASPKMCQAELKTKLNCIQGLIDYES